MVKIKRQNAALPSWTVVFQLFQSIQFAFREQQKAYKQWQRRGGGTRGGRGAGGGGGFGRWDQRGQQKARPPSINVRPEWTVLEEMDFPRLGKLSLPTVETGVDMQV